MKCKHAAGPTDTTIGLNDLLLSHAAEPGMKMLDPIYASSKCDAKKGRYVPTTELKFSSQYNHLINLPIYSFLPKYKPEYSTYIIDKCIYMLLQFSRFRQIAYYCAS